MTRLSKLVLSAAFALSPSLALAGPCETERPFWDAAGGPASALDEALHMVASPLSVALILITALAVRFRNQWGGLAAVCGWSILIGWRVFGAAGEAQQKALQEGCVGSPSLFIAIVAAICVATILYTAPTGDRSSQ